MKSQKVGCLLFEEKWMMIAKSISANISAARNQEACPVTTDVKVSTKEVSSLTKAFGKAMAVVKMK